MNPENSKQTAKPIDNKTDQVKKLIRPELNSHDQSDTVAEVKHNRRQMILGIVMIALVFAVAGWSLWLNYTFRHDQTLSDGLTSLQEGTKLFVAANGTAPKELSSLVGCDTGYNEYTYTYGNTSTTVPKNKPSKYVYPGVNKCPLDNKQDYSYGLSDNFKSASICAHFISPGHHDSTLTEVSWDSYLCPFGVGSNYREDQPYADDTIGSGINQAQSVAKDAKVTGGKVNRCTDVVFTDSYKTAFKQRSIAIPDDKFDELVKRFNTDGEASATTWYKTEVVKNKPDTGLSKTRAEASIKPKFPTCNQTSLMTRTATDVSIVDLTYQSPGILSTKSVLVSFRFTDGITTPAGQQTYFAYACGGSPYLEQINNATKVSGQVNLKWDPLTGGIWSTAPVTTTP